MNFSIQSFGPQFQGTNATADAGLNKSLEAGSILQDFAKMLIVQITNQDPNSPMDPTAIISQFAQVQASMGTAKLSEELNYYNKSHAAMAVVGKQVHLEDPKNPDQTVDGLAEGAEFTGDEPGIIVNGESYPISWLNATAI